MVKVFWYFLASASGEKGTLTILLPFRAKEPTESSFSSVVLPPSVVIVYEMFLITSAPMFVIVMGIDASSPWSTMF